MRSRAVRFRAWNKQTVIRERNPMLLLWVRCWCGRGKEGEHWFSWRKELPFEERESEWPQYKNILTRSLSWININLYVIWRQLSNMYRMSSLGGKSLPLALTLVFVFYFPNSIHLHPSLPPKYKHLTDSCQESSSDQLHPGRISIDFSW